MKNNRLPHQPLSIDKLEALIESYFDGTTTEGEETLLRIELSRTPHKSPTIEEAQAVLGFFTVGAAKNQKNNRRINRRWIAYAAAIAIIAGIGLTKTLSISNKDNNICYAYVNGKKITDSNTVMKLMNQDLQSIQTSSMDANEIMNNDLSEMAEAINDNETIINKK